MRIEEAAWIGERLRDVGLESRRPACGRQPLVLNLGSGSRRFREVSKPFIDAAIFEPLRNLGAQVVHSDLRREEGVDVCGDIFDPLVQARLRSLRPDVVLACNFLEHLDPGLRVRLPLILDSLLCAGSVLVVTAPFSYPYHGDPIDTMYRPRPDEIRMLFPGYEVLASATIESAGYGQEFVRGGWGRMVAKALRLLFPFVRPKRWLSHAHRMLWLFRPYLVSGVVLRKPVARSEGCAPSCAPQTS